MQGDVEDEGQATWCDTEESRSGWVERVATAEVSRVRGDDERLG